MTDTQQEDLFNQQPSDPPPPVQPAPPPLSQFRTEREKASASIRDLKAKLENDTKTERFWADVIGFAESSRHLHLLDLLGKEKPRMDAMKHESPELFSQLEMLSDDARAQSENTLRHFPSLFSEACKNAGLTLDSDCRHPKYTFAERFLTLEIHTDKKQAVLETREGRIGRRPADIPELVEWLKQEGQRLFGRKFNGEKFLKTIRTAYKKILSKEKKTDGESIPVREVLKKLDGKTDEKNIDLAKLSRLSPQPSVEGKRIDFQQTKDTDNGMLLWKSTGGYIGFIIFTGTEKQEDWA